MTDFAFSVDWLVRDFGPPSERATFGALRMAVGQTLLTEVLDSTAQTRRESVRVSLRQLAAWISSNWWRLRWEGPRKNVDWRMSHDLPAVGGGFLWPPIRFSSHGDWVTVSARPDRANDELVRYLCTANVSVPAPSFETWTDQLMALVLARLEAVGVPDPELADLWNTVLQERLNPTLATRRRHEALLGCDPEEVDDEVLSALDTAARWMGSSALDELLSASGPADISDLLTEVEFAKDNAWDPWDLAFASGAAMSAPVNLPPWDRGFAAARSLRAQLSLGDDPLTTDRIEALVGSEIMVAGPSGVRVGTGFRNGQGPWSVRPALRSLPQPSRRRFEVARLIGDAMVSPHSERVLALTNSDSSRQKFQRSFAQELLAPIDGLKRRVSLPEPSAGEISDAASEYDVSEFLVVSALLNHRCVSRSYVEHLH